MASWSETALAAPSHSSGTSPADVQTEAPDGSPFDVAMSQFGVMSVDESVTVFANIRAHARLGGRLTFICWQSLADNPWFTGTVLQEFCPPAPPPGPGKNAIGPITLADLDYTTSVLSAAGWSAVERTPHRQTVAVKAEVLLDDDAYLRYLGVAPDRVDEARAACVEHLALFQRADDSNDAPLAFQGFTARN